MHALAPVSWRGCRHAHSPRLTCVCRHHRCGCPPPSQKGLLTVLSHNCRYSSATDRRFFQLIANDVRQQRRRGTRRTAGARPDTRVGNGGNSGGDSGSGSDSEDDASGPPVRFASGLRATSLEFVVRHFTAPGGQRSAPGSSPAPVPVRYSTRGFIQANRRSMPAAFEALIQGSSDPLIVEMLGRPSDATAPSTHRSGRGGGGAATAAGAGAGSGAGSGGNAAMATPAAGRVTSFTHDAGTSHTCCRWLWHCCPCMRRVAM